MTPRRSHVALLFAFALVLVAALATPASAHAVLESSSPGAGAQLPAGRPPTTVDLQFSESVSITADAVKVFTAAGDAVKIGSATHPGGDTLAVRADLPALADGAYLVTWRAVSDDGHPIQGAFTFAVGAAQASDAAGRAGAVLSAQGASRAVGIGFGLVRALAFAAALVLVGGLFFVRWIAPGLVDDRGTRRLLNTAWVGAFVTAVLGFVFQAAYAAGGGLSSLVDSGGWGDALDTRTGRAWLVRALALLVYLILLRMLRQRDVLLTVFEIVAAVFLFGSIAAAGHASTGRWIALALVTDIVHLAAAAAWLGGIAVLVVVLVRHDPPAGIDDDVHRFSRLALPAVIIVVATGVLQAWRQVGALGNLTDASYGRLLLVKTGLVVVIVGLAAISRRAVLARLDATPDATPDDRAAGGVGAATTAVIETATVHRRRLRQAVLAEAVVAVGVIAVTAALVVSPPPREVAAPSPQVYNEALSAEGVTFLVELSPTTVGQNAVHLTTTNPTGAPLAVQEMTARIALPERDIPPIDIPLQRITSNHYVSENFLLPYAGKWKLTVRALVSDTEEPSVSADIDIR